MLDPSFFSYVTVMSITPGPNNLMLATSGVNFGMRRTLPMVMGVMIGCAIQTAIAGLLLDVLLQWMSTIRLPLTLLGCAYLLWLSWRIFCSGAPEMQGKARPMTLVGSALFQAVNPKAWLMVINVALMYTSNSGILAVAIGFMVLNFPCIMVWAMIGDQMRRHLQVPWKRRLFNTVMALSLVVTTLWMLSEVIHS
ncbi:LysE family translocator [Erwinia endophytica]|uniref:LysE family translocator n=1 Tax=Erwinia endophytica TaxID=1563158 RepID=UPI0012660144|nr:LysE family translocator [Erwinia endophytica]KAB8310494.1 LysE family translocator [Erwinia endophytica]